MAGGGVCRHGKWVVQKLRVREVVLRLRAGPVLTGWRRCLRLRAGPVLTGWRRCLRLRAGSVVTGEEAGRAAVGGVENLERGGD
ncbi:hypothetical protein chiPu_0008093 [Chiloscyllium punctatum]|uniref:Uncharacterized protein n=1 Tax=Chiloscyllium punctatum TaxID=137246 RepID=A0A401SH26_CHIPU|nr:hypothetical protein [Chiloscyllium punctatum]